MSILHPAVLLAVFIGQFEELFAALLGRIEPSAIVGDQESIVEKLRFSRNPATHAHVMPNTGRDRLCRASIGYDGFRTLFYKLAPTGIPSHLIESIE